MSSKIQNTLFSCRVILPLIMLAVSVLILPSVTLGSGYTVTDLGTFGGTGPDANTTTSINDSGQVIGHSLLADPALGGHAFLYNRGEMTDLFPFDINFGSGNAINNSGQIAGFTHDVNGVLQPALYQNGAITVLPTLGVGDGAYAVAINNRGQAVGDAYIGNGPYIHAVVWSGGTVTDIGSFALASYANNINDVGMVIGVAFYGITPDGNWIQNSFLYSNGHVTDLAQFGISDALDINNRGDIVGTKNLTDGSFHAVLFRDGTTHDIHKLGVISEADAINERGQIVGVYTYTFPDTCCNPVTNECTECTGYAQHPYIYENGIMTDLNKLIPSDSGWELQYVTDINNSGRIVGWGLHDGETRAFLLTPVLGVAIDIKPGGGPNNINPKSNGMIPVAILSTKDFYAPSQIDLSSLTFGRTGDEPSLAFCSGAEDVNRDGLQDLVCHFYTQDTGFQCGATKGILKGQTTQGMPIDGSDSVKIGPCK